MVAEKMDDFPDNLPPMDLMRSEKMTFVQLIIPVESAHRAVSYLGELGLLQFRDVSFPLRSDSVFALIAFDSSFFSFFPCLVAKQKAETEMMIQFES